MRTIRADGQRNRERIIAAATELVRRDGAQASLEEIARSAGVGSATLHRHFASRRELLEVVFRDGVAQLCARGAAKPGRDPAVELSEWLEDLVVYTAKNRGLPVALLSVPDAPAPEEICCTSMVHGVLDRLVRRARSAGALRACATTSDLMLLVNAIGTAAENRPAVAKRLLDLALAGIFAAP